MTAEPSINPNSAPLEGSSGAVSASGAEFEAQDVRACERAADGRTADPGQLVVLRDWLAAEVLKIQHRLPLMRVPEVWRSMDGMAHGLDYAVRVIDSFTATGRLPVTGGRCDCADPEVDHKAMAVAAHERARTERDDELAVLRAQVEALQGALARVRVLLPLNRDLDASPLRMIPATELRAALDAAPTPEAGR